MMAENKEAYVSTLIFFEDLSSSSSMRSTSSRGSVYEDPAWHLEMKLDDVANNNQTTFTVQRPPFGSGYGGALAYIKINASHDYEVECNAKDIRKSKSGISEDITDDIVFSRQDEQTLNHPPSVTIDTSKYKWLGNTPRDADGKKVNVTFDGMKIKLSFAVTGILRCVYKTKWDQWEINQYDEAEIVVVSYIPNSNAIAYLTVSFVYGPDDTPGPEAYEIQVLDYCTDDPIEGAAVTFDGELIGYTDENGLLFLGPLYAGTYPLSMTKDGYIDSASDKLHNDSVVISEEPESSSSSSTSSS